jgi:hypothetical protein
MPDTPDKALCPPFLKKWDREFSRLTTKGIFDGQRSVYVQCSNNVKSWLHSSGLGKLIEAGKALRHPGGRNTVADMRAWDAALRQFEEASRGK